jgi:hypothetical protein
MFEFIHDRLSSLHLCQKSGSFGFGIMSMLVFIPGLPQHIAMIPDLNNQSAQPCNRKKGVADTVGGQGWKRWDQEVTEVHKGMKEGDQTNPVQGVTWCTEKGQSPYGNRC